MLSVSLPVLGWCINTAWTLPLYIKGLFWLKRKKCYPQMIIVDWKHNSKYSIFTREILLNPINCSRVLKSAGLKGLTVQRWMISNLTKRGWLWISPPSEGQTRCSSAWREEGWHLGLNLGRLHQLRRRWWWQLWWWWWRKMKWGFSRGDQLLMWKTIFAAMKSQHFMTFLFNVRWYFCSPLWEIPPRCPSSSLLIMQICQPTSDRSQITNTDTGRK